MVEWRASLGIGFPQPRTLWWLIVQFYPVGVSRVNKSWTTPLALLDTRAVLAWLCCVVLGGGPLEGRLACLVCSAARVGTARVLDLERRPARTLAPRDTCVQAGPCPQHRFRVLPVHSVWQAPYFARHAQLVASALRHPWGTQPAQDSAPREHLGLLQACPVPCVLASARQGTRALQGR